MQENKSLVESIEELRAAGGGRLAPGGAAAGRLRQIPLEGDLWIERVTPVLTEDPVLAARFLRLANSAFFRGLRKVTTIREALVRLGAEQTAGLVRQTVREATADPRSPLVRRYLEALRLHSQACAQASRWLAERSGYRHLGQEAFLAGLLHDLGKFYLLQMLDELAARGGSPMPLSETLVVEVLDGMHVDQGCRLMEEWNLPEIYLQVAGRHHHEEFDGKASLTGVVRLANQACRKLGLGIHCNPEIILAVTPEAQTLGIGEIPLAELEIMLEDTFLAAQPVPPL